MINKNPFKFWVVAANMGFGHLRAVYAFEKQSNNEILVAGINDHSNKKVKNHWDKILFVYELFSRIHGIPIIGKPIFSILDFFLSIPPLRKNQDYTKSNFQLNILYKNIKNGLCDGIIKIISTKKIPLLSSFYATSLAAEINGVENNFCIICDAEINRVWVAKKPKESNIIYFTPCESAVERLLNYGVPSNNIKLTGFPLPNELTGNNHSILKNNLLNRIARLDPNNNFINNNQNQIEKYLGEVNKNQKTNNIPTITFAIGGAGAQKEIGRAIAISLKKELQENKIHLNIIGGMNRDVYKYIKNIKRELKCKNINIHYSDTFSIYYKIFNNILSTTDILWTKPSELSFYTALGLPIIMAPAIGSQEIYNNKWLMSIDSAIDQKNISNTSKWLFEKINSGEFARLAFNGFLKARKYGTQNILNAMQNEPFIESIHENES